MFIKVFVTPGARKERVDKKDETLLIAVKEPAAGNAANKRVRELVAQELHKPLSAVRILTGHRSRAKMISVDS